MADNVTANAGAGGAVFATDDITAVHYPINKLAFGALDSATLAASGAGAVAAGVQRVTLASDDPAVALLTTMDSDTSTLAVVGGGVEATALRVTIASDSTGVVSIDDNGGAITVDGSVSITGAVDTELTTADLDTGAGTDTRAVVGLVGSASGGGALIPGSATDGLLVNLGTNNDVSVTGTVTVDGSGVTQPVSHAALTELAAAINVSSQMDVNIAASAATVAVSNAGITTIAGAVSGTEMQVDVVAALPAGTNAIGKLAANSGVDIGDVDVTSISAGTNAIGNVGLIGRTSGGLTIFRSLDIDETEEEIKATAGQLFSITAFNTTAAPLYLKFYNATAANVTVGSTTPVLTFVVPGNADSDGAGFVWNNDIGFAFGTAITVACTTAVADADTGAPGANACIINIGYM